MMNHIFRQEDSCFTERDEGMYDVIQSADSNAERLRYSWPRLNEIHHQNGQMENIYRIVPVKAIMMESPMMIQDTFFDGNSPRIK
eukprot:1718487-Ditylum_brightwellii.AAC.1